MWCMEVWTRVVVAYADSEELRPLVYPLVQIILGAAKLLPAARYFPLRLRLVRQVSPPPPRHRIGLRHKNYFVCYINLLVIHIFF